MSPVQYASKTSFARLCWTRCQHECHQRPREAIRSVLGKNLATVLSAAGGSFEDVVELTTYHVGLQQHMHTFRKVKDRIFLAEHALDLHRRL